MGETPSQWQVNLLNWDPLLKLKALLMTTMTGWCGFDPQVMIILLMVQKSHSQPPFGWC